MSPPGSASRSFAILSAGQTVSRLLAFATTVYLTRTLLPERFGVVVFAMSVVEYAGLIVNFGFDFLGPVEVARGRIPLGALVRTILTFRLLLALVAFGALALFTAVVPLPHLTKVVLLWYGASAAVAALDLKWVFLGAESMGRAATAEIIPQALQAIGAVLVIRGPEDVLRMPFLFLAGQVAAAGVLALLFVRRFGGLSLGLDLSLLRRLLPAAVPLGGGAAVGLVLHNFDLVLLGLWLGSEAAGLYGSAYRVVWIPVMLLSAHLTAVRPAFARGFLPGARGLERLFSRVIRINAGLGMGVVAGGILLAHPLVEFLYGPDYRGAVVPLQILMASFALMLVSRPYRLLLATSNREWVDFRTVSLAAGVNVVLNVVLVPRLGPVGSALAAVLCEVVILWRGQRTARSLLGRARLGGALLRPLFPTAALAAVLLGTGGLPVLARIALGGVVYLGLAVALRIIEPREVRSLFGTEASTAAADTKGSLPS